MTTEPESIDGGDGSGELYDHQVRKPKNIGLAFVASALFWGGGQLVKGHFKRFVVLWGLLLATIFLGVVALSVFDTGSSAAEIAKYALIGAIGLLWFYQVWDAVTRP